jgi:hypothetical protein
MPRLTVTLTGAQYTARADAVAERGLSLEDQERWREVGVLDRAWDNLQDAWETAK